MDANASATEYFQHLSEWQVVICKQCRHGVWPQEVQGHLQGGQHRVSVKQAKTIAAEVQEWPGVTQCKTDLVIPQHISEPIAEIPLHTDGLKCRVDPERCSHVCRKGSMRKHWQEVHGFSVKEGRGRPGQGGQGSVKRRFRQNAKPVYCQRFFPSRHGSNYFEVRQPETARPEQVHFSTTEAALHRAWERANVYWDAMREKQNNTIQPGEKDEVSPWLKRTGWIEYLKGCDRKDLLHSIRKPGDDEEEEEEEPIESAIWEAMGVAAARSQRTVQQSGVMLRLEAVRTEMHQTRYQPLQPYQDPKSIDKRCRPWQQMLMFFVRTQKQHDWRSPAYRFSRRQDAAFHELIAAAEEVVEEVEEGEGEDGEERDGEVGSGSEQQVGTEDHGEGDENRPLNRIEKACVAFCIELLNQRIHNREYDMALVCAMSVLGVDPFHGGFRDPETYPPILSSIMKVARFMVIQQAEQIARPAEEDDMYSPCESACDFEDSGYESGGSSRSDRGRISQRRGRKQHQSSFDWVHRMMDQFVVRGTGSPMQWLLDLRTYGLKIHYNTTAIGHVNWKDKYTLEYKALRFTMDEFRQMVHDLRVAAHKALFEDLLFAESAGEIPSIPWDHMHDDPTNGEVGWDFIHDPRSQWPVDGQEWLFQRIQRQANLRERFVRADADTGIDKERMRDYMRQVARFRGLLLILMHISGGQPARGTEILSVRHRNTAQGGHRNLFIEDGSVVFVTKYHKGMIISGDVKIIHRYLPREVGELVVWYLWLALPFIQRMEAMLWKKQAMSDHMWPMDVEGKKWTTDRMKEELQQASRGSLGQTIHVAAYREIAIAISRQWVRGPTQFQLDEAEENDEWRQENMLSDAADEQATHSPHIAGLIYARNSTEMFGTTSDNRRKFRAVSTEWHRFLAFESIGIKDEKTDMKRKRSAFEDDASNEQIERRIRLRRMDATSELQRMMRKEVTLRSAQGEAMEAIQGGENFVVAVMPTGAGKSVLFMLPAWVEPGGMTIVVVPLKALRRDMIYRCESIGVKVAVWSERNQCDGASIVLVTPEKAAVPEFGTFISRVRRNRRLDRIVIDECHTILNDQLQFRKHLQEMGKLAGAETQMVLLTATLPPTEEHKLFERMFWRREEVRMIRASTVRQNIRYSIIDGGKRESERDKRLEAIVEEVLGDPEQPEGKVVIMCESKRKVEKIVEAGLFPCEMFHADLPEKTKGETLDEFRDGNVRVIAATGAFGMGIDIPDIRLIVHMDNPRNMMDYGQASGRAGRDGLPSRAMIIRGGIDFKDELVERYMDPAKKQCRRVEIDQYLDGDTEREQCQEGELCCDECERNMQVTQAPGTEVEIPPAPEPGRWVTPGSGIEAGITQVAGTEAQPTQAPESEARITQVSGTISPATQVQADGADVADRARVRREVRIQDQQRQVPEGRRIDQAKAGGLMQEEIQQRLERWKGRCVICHRAGGASRHSISKCSNPSSRPAEMERKRMQRTIRFAANAGCYKCGVPRTICTRWTADGQFRTETDSCQFYGILIGVVYGVKYGYPSIWGGWIDRMRRRGEAVDSVEEIEKFLGRPTSREGVEGNELLQAFMWTTAKIENEDSMVENGVAKGQG